MRIKKLIACSMIAVMTVGVIGCGKKSSEKTDTTEAVTEAEEEEEPEVEEADDEMEAELPIESSLKGTGAATPESLASNTDAEDGGGLQIGDTLVDINFDDGDIDGFFEYMQGGEYALAAEDGKLVAKIKSCGKLDYANQAYWDGFALSQNCVYTYSFDISCDIERGFPAAQLAVVKDGKLVYENAWGNVQTYDAVFYKTAVYKTAGRSECSITEIAQVLKNHGASVLILSGEDFSMNQLERLRECCDNLSLPLIEIQSGWHMPAVMHRFYEELLLYDEPVHSVAGSLLGIIRQPEALTSRRKPERWVKKRKIKDMTR